MKKIVWKPVSKLPNIVEGYVGDEHLFMIEGRLCVTDLRAMKASKASGEFVLPKHYKIKDREDGKRIAHELLNGINLEVHQANWEAREAEHKKTADLIASTDDLLTKIKAELAAYKTYRVEVQDSDEYCLAVIEVEASDGDHARQLAFEQGSKYNYIEGFSIENFKYPVVKSELRDKIIKDVRYWYALGVTPELVDKFLAETTTMCFDTLERGDFGFFAGKLVVGKDAVWPCNGDSDVVKGKFFKAFLEKAPEHGIKTFWDNAEDFI